MWNGVELAYAGAGTRSRTTVLTSALLKRVKYLARINTKRKLYQEFPMLTKHNAEIVTRELLKMGPEAVVLLGSEGVCSHVN